MPLVTIPAVEIARVGAWSASTGPWNCTRNQLAAAVRAYESRHFRAPVMKRGHTDARFEGDVQAGGDGEPTLGVLRNLRLTNGGDSLVADLRVPDWLASDLPATYPSRSIEADLGVETADGETFDMVVTGLALLGETKPAIQSLADLPDAEPEPMQYLAAMSVAASIPLSAAWNVEFTESKHPRKGGKFVSKGSGYAKQSKGDQAPEVRSLQRELIRLGFLSPKSGKNGGIDGLFGPATEAAVRSWQRKSGSLATGRVTPQLLATLKGAKKGGNPAKETAGRKAARKKSSAAKVVDAIAKKAKDAAKSAVRAAADDLVDGLDEGLTVREILADAVVYASADGLVWVADWDEDAENGVEIGELTPASVTYTPVHVELHASEVESIPGLGHPSGSSLGATQVEITPEMREALGVDEHADEQAILAALKARSSAVPPPAPEGTAVETPAVPAAPVVPSVETSVPTEATSETISASAAVERLAKLESRLAASDDAIGFLKAELGRTTGELAARKAAEAVTRRETLLASAVREGRITPAHKDHYGKIYDTDAATAESLLASLAPGSAVPLSAVGHSGDAQQDDEFKSLTAAMGWGA